MPVDISNSVLNCGATPAPSSRRGAILPAVCGRPSLLALVSPGFRGVRLRSGAARFGLAEAGFYSGPAQSTGAGNGQIPFVILPNRANPGSPALPQSGHSGYSR